jgi:hypothetical protein
MSAASQTLESPSSALRHSLRAALGSALTNASTDAEAVLRQRIESAKRIIRDHPEMSFNEAMLELTPLPRLAYSLKDAAKVLGISYISMYRLYQRGRIRVCKELPGHILVPASELIRFLDQTEPNVAAQARRPRSARHANETRCRRCLKQPG